jgi:peptidyl-prolyl cis-trans isomerase C
MTLEELRQKLMIEALPSAVLEREMKSQVPVTDEQAKKFYADNPAKFEEPEKVRVAHILIATRTSPNGPELTDDQKAAKRKQADDLLKRVKAGEDFGKLARQYSDDPGSKENGGEYPAFPRGTMVGPFEAAAFSMKAGEVSGVVTTDYGFHIIKTLEKIPARTVPYSEVSDKIKDYLVQQQAAKLAPVYFAKIKKEAGVEIVDPELKAEDEAAQKDAEDVVNTPVPGASPIQKPAKP